MKKIMLGLAILICLVSVVQAQKGHPHKGQHKKSPEERAELRQYFKTEIYPILKTEHEAFEARLSADDISFLQKKRQEAAKLKAERKDLQRQIHGLVKNGSSREEARAQFSSQIENVRNRHKALEASLTPFIEKNNGLILQSIEVLKPHYEKWKVDRKAIRSKYQTNVTTKNKHPQHAEKGKGMDRKIRRFLLWDGTLKMEDKKGKKGQNVAPNSKIEQDKKMPQNYALKSFPNPATNEANISFELTKPSKIVYIRLLDLKGLILREIPLKNLNPGTHTVQLNVSDIEKGSYLISIEVDGQRSSDNFIKQ